MDSKSVILSPDNLDEVNTFIGITLAGMNTGMTTEQKAARIEKWKADMKE